MAFAAARMIKEKAKRPSIDFQLNPVSHYFIFIDHSLSSLGFVIWVQDEFYNLESHDKLACDTTVFQRAVLEEALLCNERQSLSEHQQLCLKAKLF